MRYYFFFFFSSRRRHTRFKCDWSSDVCSSDLAARVLRPAMQEAVDRLVVRLMASDLGNAVPQIGDQMPPFILTDEQGDLVSLAGLLRVGPVAVTFHRGHW